VGAARLTATMSRQPGRSEGSEPETGAARAGNSHGYNLGDNRAVARNNGLGTPQEGWWRWEELNLRHGAYETPALPLSYTADPKKTRQLQNGILSYSNPTYPNSCPYLMHDQGARTQPMARLAHAVVAVGDAARLRPVRSIDRPRARRRAPGSKAPSGQDRGANARDARPLRLERRRQAGGEPEPPPMAPRLCKDVERSRPLAFVHRESRRRHGELRRHFRDVDVDGARGLQNVCRPKPATGAPELDSTRPTRRPGRADPPAGQSGSLVAAQTASSGGPSLR
jgi:hypothetical protein